jgi:anti-sigma factor RsiW
MAVLQSYLDGEVDDATARRVAAHLDVCAACGPEADVYRRIKQSLEGAARPIDPEVLAGLERFGRRLAQGEAGR